MQLLERADEAADEADEDALAAHKRASGIPAVADTAPSLAPPSAAERVSARRYMFFLNLAVLWAYQSLLAAQDLYEAKWPSAHLAFIGTVSVSAAMGIGQPLTMASGLGERAAVDAPMIGGYALFGAIGLALLAAPSAEAIVVAFFVTGLVNCATEAPLYSIAAHCWPDGALTEALNAGNGAAGAVNIVALATIRGATSALPAGRLGALELSNRLFLSLSVLVNCLAILVFRRLVALPTIATALAARGAAVAAAPARAGLLRAPRAALREHCAPYAAVWPAVRQPAAVQFLIFVATLAVWPGVACATRPTGWCAARPEWYCSPLIIGVFNLADFAGRLLAATAWATRALPLGVCAQLAVARLALALALALAARGALPPSTAGVCVAVGLLGASNGLLATRTMVLGPERVAEPALRGAAAGLMVLALYWGIGIGACLGLVFGTLALFRFGAD